MIKTDIDERMDRVQKFIDLKNKEIEKEKTINDINTNYELKMRKLNKECENGKSVCIDHILGRIYKDALPFNDPKRNCSDEVAANQMHDYINTRTGGKNSEYYIREGIKKTNSSTLKNILTESEKIVKKFYSEKASNIGKINVNDLNFNMNDKSEDLDKITKKLELDEVSKIIRDNVEKSINDEIKRSQKEEEYNSSLEDKLSKDPNIVDDTSMESALNKMNVLHEPTVYQPSLFEAIMIGNTTLMEFSSENAVFYESVREYTKLNISKALKLESFSINDIKKLANQYVSIRK